MQAILLVTVFSCLLGAAAAVAAGDVGGACLTGSSCTASTSVCESSLCKVKAGAACSVDADCVSYSTCPSGTTKCTCGGGYTQLSTGLCTNGAAGAPCYADGTCADATLLCESSMCKLKAGQTCTASPTNCVSQSTCSTTCNCNSGYTALTTGLCNGVAPQSVSSWLLTGSIITLLVTFSLP